MIAVLIPAYNAEKTLPRLLEKLFHQVPRTHVLVVDDGSEDATGAVAQEAGVMVLRNARNEGKGAALKTGLDFLRSRPEIEAVVTMDADLQHRPEDLPGMLAGWKESGANMVVGCRKRWGTSMPIHRKFSNSITSWLVAARTRQPIPDSQCGYRLIEREVFEDVEISAKGFEAETEFLIKAARRGWRIAWVPIQTVYDDETSAMTGWLTTKRFLRTLLKDL